MSDEELFEYARRGRLAKVQAALKAGAKPDGFLAYDGASALVAACRGGHGKVVQALVEAQADVGVRTEDGATLMLHAAAGGSAVAVTVLADKGLSVNEANEDQVTPLMLASLYDHAEAVGVLVKAGADVNASAPEWGTALDRAKPGSKVEMILKEHGGKSAGADVLSAERPAAASEVWSYGTLEDQADVADRMKDIASKSKL
mmetsp:Transcript_3454/g.7795  ORF Transcript_3454/g.7795 Transcript_3454/m.7795 type:complete len:202 (-) Transcript_3454:2-607(-)